jgi:hypothetical protein
VSIKNRIDCALLQQALSHVLTHMRFMGSHKLSISMVVELNDTLSRFTNDTEIVFGPPTYPSRFSCRIRH